MITLLFVIRWFNGVDLYLLFVFIAGIWLATTLTRGLPLANAVNVGIRASTISLLALALILITFTVRIPMEELQSAATYAIIYYASYVAGIWIGIILGQSR